MTQTCQTHDVASLVARAADGDQAAWSALVDAFGGGVWATARACRLDGPDAADVFQTTWLRLVESLDRIRDPQRLAGWLATTARRESLRVRRGSLHLVSCPGEVPEAPSDRCDPDARLIAEQRTVAVRDALDQLAARDRALLRMLATEPAPSYATIGAALGMPVGSIGPTRARALTALRATLDVD
jgi:RNA polymerase sigma factor (sigma-70 family)